MYDALVMALRDYMRKTGFTRAVVAVSGGIDSALALAIAVDALGADRVRAYNLPSKYNTETTRSIAARLAAALGVRYGVIPISGIDDESRADVRSARPPDRAQPDAREPARAHPRPADDGRVERHRRAAHVLRQRDRDRARLRHALRRHVRRHLASSAICRRSTSTAWPATSTATAARSIPRGHVHARAVGRARRGAVRSVRLRRDGAGRRRARRAAAQPGELVRSSSAARSIRRGSVPTPRAGPSTTSTPPRRSAPCRRRLPADAPLGLQAAAGPADRRRQRARLRLRSARDDHQWMDGVERYWVKEAAKFDTKARRRTKTHGGCHGVSTSDRSRRRPERPVSRRSTRALRGATGPSAASSCTSCLRVEPVASGPSLTHDCSASLFDFRERLR